MQNIHTHKHSEFIRPYAYNHKHAHTLYASKQCKIEMIATEWWMAWPPKKKHWKNCMSSIQSEIKEEKNGRTRTSWLDGSSYYLLFENEIIIIIIFCDEILNVLPHVGTERERKKAVVYTKRKCHRKLCVRLFVCLFVHLFTLHQKRKGWRANETRRNERENSERKKGSVWKIIRSIEPKVLRSIVKNR